MGSAPKSLADKLAELICPSGKDTKVSFPVNLNLLDAFKDAKLETLESNTISAFLLSRKNQPSFFDDFMYYNSNLNEYVKSFGEKFIGFVKGDETILRKILESYLNSLYDASLNETLFELLFNCFLKLCAWKQSKTLSNGGIPDPGIYVLYNTVTGISYIGESKSIEMRFISHKLSLINETHFNQGLLESVRQNSLESLLFLIVDYGSEYANLDIRRAEERRIINTWPGSIYNIKDVYRKTFPRKLF